MENIDFSKLIIETINTLISTLISSIDSNTYSLLDTITFIDLDVLNGNTLTAISDSVSFNFNSISNALLLGVTLYYSIRYFVSLYTGTQVERPYQFIFKILIFGILSNYSYSIIDFILLINSYITDFLRAVEENICGVPISFNSLISQMNQYISQGTDTFSLFSFDGIIKSFASFGLISLLFSYSIRFIMIRVFILLSPFAFITLVNSSSSWIFKSWFKNLISLLFFQSFISIILFVSFSISSNISGTISQIIYIGSIFALSKANSYMKEIFGGISTDISTNLGSLKNYIK